LPDFLPFELGLDEWAARLCQMLTDRLQAIPGFAQVYDIA